MNITDLKDKFNIEGEVEFIAGKGDLPMVSINNQHAKALVSLYGAQVLSYQPHGEKEMLWVSGSSLFSNGKAIRGGIPICFPWFGPHPTDTKKPPHGFARLSTWKVIETSTLHNGKTILRLNLSDSVSTRSMWPYEFKAEVMIIVGKTLELTLKITNTGKETFTFTDALHTYLNVSRVSNISINGLGNVEYQDALDAFSIKKQEEEILRINQETNRRYINTSAESVLTDYGFNRKIRVAKKNSNTTVVWNPWEETTQSFNDMDPDGYLTMMCIEASNSLNDFVSLDPSKSFSISTILSLD